MEKNEKNVAYCMRCDHELILDEVEELEGKVYRYHCPHCGTVEECYECPEDSRSDYPYYSEDAEDNGLGSCSHGYDGLCPICGNHIVWQSDFMYSDIYGQDEDCELNEYGCPVDDSLVSEVFCPTCGASCTIIEPLPSQMHLYPAYAEDNKE